MKKRNVVSAILAVIAVGFLILRSHTAQAQSATDRCEKEIGDAQIAACTEVIRQDKRAAWAYVNRGLEWSIKKGEYNKAIAEFNEAIRLNPRHAEAYGSRGMVWEAKGDFDKAIADYKESIRLDPKDANSRKNLDQVLKNRGR